MNGGCTASCLVRPTLSPLVYTFFSVWKQRGAFRFPGVTWDHFRCTVEPSSGHNRCRAKRGVANRGVSRSGLVRPFCSVKSKWGLSNGGLSTHSAMCASSSTIVRFCDNCRQSWTIVDKHLKPRFAKPPFRLSRVVLVILFGLSRYFHDFRDVFGDSPDCPFPQSTRNSPEGVRDTIRTFPEKSENPPVWKPRSLPSHGPLPMGR